MNRIIKFRGKSLSAGEWIFGYYVKSRGRHYVLRDYNDSGYDERWENSEWIEINYETLGQFTGFHDSGDKEIYGNDIIETINLFSDSCSLKDSIMKKWKAIVCFEYGMWYLRDVSFRNRSPYQELYDAHEYVAVIGNASDNPELAVV